ncbi:MAG: hypothetical protein QM809_12385 [Gordonia sp. (in: high G+C Gram-positive bacteria)]|uniref:hypothetical protein n=1 Tax=Gordonia sp. (in: high G+C Gram-positive bacteria) TaxID=84139 RepID=UPI0039E5D8F4
MTGSDTPMPSPAALAARAAQTTAEPGDPADHPVTGEVRELLAQAASIRESAEGAFSLAALSRQGELLVRAHDALSATLEEVGRG